MKRQGLCAISQIETSIPRYCLIFSSFYNNKDRRSFLPNLGKRENEASKTSSFDEIQIHDHCDEISCGLKMIMLKSPVLLSYLIL